VSNRCDVCLTRGLEVPATHVATGADHTQWFECLAHQASDNIHQIERVKLEPLEAWLGRARGWQQRPMTELEQSGGHAEPKWEPSDPRWAVSAGVALPAARELLRLELAPGTALDFRFSNAGTEPSEIVLTASGAGLIGVRVLGAGSA
jgi:hypothetical protein